ncbi:MAG: VOC family protein, partial [candidate division Zixibacteria bacterium]
EGLHHICIRVDNIEKQIERLQDAGYKMIDTSARIGAEGDRIAFVHPKASNGVLLELQEVSE